MVILVVCTTLHSNSLPSIANCISFHCFYSVPFNRIVRFVCRILDIDMIFKPIRNSTLKRVCICMKPPIKQIELYYCLCFLLKSLNETTLSLSSYFWPTSFTFISMAMLREKEQQKRKEKSTTANTAAKQHEYLSQTNEFDKVLQHGPLSIQIFLTFSICKIFHVYLVNMRTNSKIIHRLLVCTASPFFNM